MSWALTLLVMGVFTGLVTAVFAREGDAPVAARFVTSAQATHALATTPGVASILGSASVVTGVILPAVPTVHVTDLPLAAPRRAPLPVAYAAPPKRDTKKDTIGMKRADASKAEKKEAVLTSSKGSKKPVGRTDVDAEATNALATAQLEQAMR